MDIFWTDSIKCGFCDTRFSVTVSDVKYGDLRQEFMFVPDWQYYVECQCGRKHVITSVPFSVAEVIQKLYTATEVGNGET